MTKILDVELTKSQYDVFDEISKTDGIYEKLLDLASLWDDEEEFGENNEPSSYKLQINVVSIASEKKKEARRESERAMMVRRFNSLAG